MFDLLKKKFSQFVEEISKKGFSEEKKQAEAQKETIETKETESKEAKNENHAETENKTGKNPEIEETKAIEFQKSDSRELKAEISIASAIKSVFSSEIRLSGKDIGSFLEELELSLLEADVEQNTAGKICSEIEKNLDGKKIPKNELNQFLKKEIKKILQELMHVEKTNFLEKISEKKPFVMLFLGPNGAGKTTTIAKIASYLQQNKKTVLLAAGDTFRAASIEQLEKHAVNLGIKVVRQNYGADPAAVAFDAVAAAKAKGIDVVLVDSAGRQETNKNLLGELEKICRIIKPDLKIYIGESYSGQALLHQATEFDKHLNLNGFILTKLDVDAKGGTAISLLYNLKKPIYFIGIGQEYEDLIPFDEKFVLEKIIG